MFCNFKIKKWYNDIIILHLFLFTLIATGWNWSTRAQRRGRSRGAERSCWPPWWDWTTWNSRREGKTSLRRFNFNSTVTKRTPDNITVVPVFVPWWMREIRFLYLSLFYVVMWLQGKLGVPGLPGYPGRQGPKVRETHSYIYWRYMCHIALVWNRVNVISFSSWRDLLDSQDSLVPTVKREQGWV